MTFNSLTFIAFFAIVALLHRLPFSWHTKKVNLLVASYVFYAAWNPPFILLLWASTFIDWKVAHWIDRTDGSGPAQAGHAAVGGVQPRHARLLQVRWVPARELPVAGRDLRHRLHAARMEHRPADRHFVLHVRDDVLHARRVPASRTAGQFVPRLRAVRHLLPAPGRGPDPAPDRPAAAVRARVAADPPAAALGPDADDAGPVQQDRDRGRPARAGRRQGLRCQGCVADARRLARHAGVLRDRSSATSPATRRRRSARRWCSASR